MTNKFFMATLAAAIAVPAVVIPMQVEASVKLKDITSLDQVTQEKIQYLVDQGVISGFPDGTFRPTEQVTRGQFALFISEALGLPTPVKPRAFSDVTTKVATYDGIMKAADAKIVSGYQDGRFRPNEAISRSDMAIMLDRALQYKGSYPTKASLKYSDSGSIGKKSYEAVQRLTHYGVMGTYSNGESFSPLIKGNRLMTVLSIHELMNVKGLLGDGGVIKPEEPTPPPIIPGEPAFKPDARDYTFEEIKQIIGRTDTLIERSGIGGPIKTTNLVDRYYEALHRKGFAGYLRNPKEYYESDLSFLHQTHQKYQNAFPEYEMIAVNGVPYRYSEYFPEHLKNPEYSSDYELNNIIAAPPTVSGKFLIDIPTLNADIVTYKKDDIQIVNTGHIPTKTAANDFLVDSKSAFNKTGLVTVASDGLTVNFSGNELKMTVGSERATLNGSSVTLSAKVVKQGDKMLVPIQSVATHIGLSTRKLDKRRNHAKVEIANYDLPVVDLTSGSYEGLGWER